MQATKSLIAAAGTPSFGKFVLAVQDALLEKKYEKLANGVIKYDDVLDVANRRPDDDMEGTKKVLLDTIEKVQIVHDRFIDDLQKSVGAIRKDVSLKKKTREE
eukprot:3939856-Rhodomonas_salina.1